MKAFVHNNDPSRCGICLENMIVCCSADGPEVDGQPYILERYDGVDPGKGVDNDFAAVLIRSLEDCLFETDNSERADSTRPLVSAEWHPVDAERHNSGPVNRFIGSETHHRNVASTTSTPIDVIEAAMLSCPTTERRSVNRVCHWLGQCANVIESAFRDHTSARGDSCNSTQTLETARSSVQSRRGNAIIRFPKE